MFPHDTFSFVYWIFINLTTWFPCGREKILFILGSLGQRSRSPLLLIEFLTTGSFLHDNFSSVYWIFTTKLGHMIPPWKGKNPIYFGVITIIPFDNLYRQAYFVMHTFLVYVMCVCLHIVVSNTYCVVFFLFFFVLCFVYPMLPVSLDYPFFLLLFSIHWRLLDCCEFSIPHKLVPLYNLRNMHRRNSRVLYIYSPDAKSNNCVYM